MPETKWNVATLDEVLRKIEVIAREVKADPINSGSIEAVEDFQNRLRAVVKTMRNIPADTSRKQGRLFQS